MHGWGHQYVHNHAATNGAALYIAGIVLETESYRIKFENATRTEIEDKIEKIKQSGILICERAMKILGKGSKWNGKAGIGIGGNNPFPTCL